MLISNTPCQGQIHYQIYKAGYRHDDVGVVPTRIGSVYMTGNVCQQTHCFVRHEHSRKLWSVFLQQQLHEIRV